jgi:hypothetical protein
MPSISVDHPMTQLSLSLRDFEEQFCRNMRWGTCVDCPRDLDGYTYPELCKNTGRSDHRLGRKELEHKFYYKNR